MGFLCEHNVKVCSPIYSAQAHSSPNSQFFDQGEDEKGNKTHAANIRMYEKAALEALQGNSPQSTQQTQKRRPVRKLVIRGNVSHSWLRTGALRILQRT